MNWKIMVALMLWLGLVGGPGCRGDGNPPPPSKIRGSADRLQGKLLITGSITMAPLVAAIAKRFQQFHPGVEIEVQPGGSGRGLTDVLEGNADIGMVSRTLEESKEGLHSFPIARDGVGLIISRDNPVKSLTNSQVRDIFTGKTTNWREVRGRDGPIAIITRVGDRSSLQIFTRYFQLSPQLIKAQITVGNNAKLLLAISSRPDAIAFFSLCQAERRAREGAAIKLLPIDGVAATSRTVRTGEFPLSRSLHLLTKGFPTGLKLAFIEFALSSQVIDIVKDHDFVPYLH